MHRTSLPTALATFTALWIAALPAGADEQPRTIEVTGEGRVSAPPDMATIDVGVVTQAETAEKAVNQNNDAMAKLLDVLKRHGVAERDVQTSQFDVSPVYEHDERGRREPNLVAYRVTNQVTVEVRQLDRLGVILDAGVEAGSNRISGIAFEIDNREPLLRKARTMAVRNARDRATTYAEAADVALGEVRAIREASSVSPQPVRRAAEAARASERVPVATGEQELNVTVNVVYAIDD